MDYAIDLYAPDELPYPCLARQEGIVDQNLYHIEPENPTPEGGAGRVAPTQVYGELHPPASFGPLSKAHVEVSQRGLMVRRVYTRRERGTRDHGLARSGEREYETAKYNILRHPLSDGFNNPDYLDRDPGPVDGLNKALLGLADYPFIPNPVMSGPLLPNMAAFSKPRAAQPSLFTRVLQTEELFRRILGAMMHRWGDVSNFVRTCQLALDQTNQTLGRFDIRHGDFLNLHVDLDHPLTAERVAGEAGSIEMVMVSNVRRRAHGAPQPPVETNQYGFPARRNLAFAEKSTAASRVMSHIRLLKMFYLHGSNIKVLHLHSIPYLDVMTLERCLDYLPSLQTLGVHNCELLHFGCTVDMLKLIINYNNRVDRKAIKADFSPKYFYGPRSAAEGRIGEYGVIAQDEGFIDPLKGTTAVLFAVVPLARANGIDWFSPGAGLRQFLERLPFRIDTLRCILEALYDLYDLNTGVHDYAYPLYFDPDARAALGLTGYDAKFWGEPSGWDGPTSEEDDYISGTLKEEMYRTVLHDLLVALQGSPMREGELRAMITLRGELSLPECAECKSNLPVCFYTEYANNRPAGWNICHGCQLVAYLNQQVNNFGREHRDVVYELMSMPDGIDLHTLFKGKRLATDEELADRRFPFRQLAVQLMPVGFDVDFIYQPPHPLAGRPMKDASDEWKQISILKERAHDAYKYATLKIDKGHKRSNEVIRRCRANIAATPPGRGRDKFELRIAQEMARQGLGQMSPAGDFHIAMDWDAAIRSYRAEVQFEAGKVVNGGPYPIHNMRTFW
ncbi:hypothetical protein F4779DRAFT_628911 [Xylariaceae sp. FL0662B]|nr:hypothetical protein F4779DRAFT_628911 [Xylariaceae sp. FL0662B]